MTLRRDAADRLRRSVPAAAASVPDRAARAGLAATALSVLLTVTVAALGPSAMEPVLPGRRGQPPWSAVVHPSAYLVIALTAAAIVAGAAGLALTLWAARRGWRMPPGLLLGAGLLAALALALLPPFGSSDHLSYAAYGRMAATGHNPYLTEPIALARLGDPVAKAVQDWKTSTSVYGVLATGGQWLASVIGGTSARLTVFVLSLLNLAAFAGTGLILHRLAGGDRGRQLRAALLWTANPLLLQVLVAGEHVDSQAIVFGVGAVAALALALRRAAAGGLRRAVPLAVLAGVLAGLGFAVKLSMLLVPAGLAVACLAAWRTPGGRRWSAALGVAAGLAAGFAAVAGAALGLGGLTSLRPALRAGSYVSIATPLRWLRSAVQLGVGEPSGGTVVKLVAVAAAATLVVLLLRGLPGPGRPGTPDDLAGPGLAPAVGLAARAVLAFALAWLTAGPYILPWYDSLAWALLPLLPASSLDWLVLARTTSLAVGYLPARSITLPGGLGWLRTVVRTGLSPALLLIVAVLLVIGLRRSQDANRSGPAAAVK